MIYSFKFIDRTIAENTFGQCSVEAGGSRETVDVRTARFLR